MRLRIHFLAVFLLWIGCNNDPASNTDIDPSIQTSSGDIPSINLDHLNYLYKDLTLPNGRDAGIIHIYSNYPDYHFDIEPREGYTCVDDVARALILLAGETGYSDRLARLTEYLLFMQNENGWFNNFIWKDLSINTTYKTSVAEPNWWSWRAFWALEKALPIVEKHDPELSGRMTIAIDLLLNNIRIFISNLTQIDKQVEGISIATNLPFESAADQASVLLIGLCHHVQRTGDTELEGLIRQLADGILSMQIQEGLLAGMFLSWENVWHAYGNTQSFALLLTGKLLQEKRYVQAALHEIDSFYPYLEEKGFLEMMTVQSVDQAVVILDEKEFPQIAYGIRPIIYACVEAYRQTGNERYREYARQWISWLSGENSASTIIYHPENGRCYDGIKSETEVNQNSGAESTIEALLSLQAFTSIN